ncbi:MAG TPA: SGNH/GDSL hydrolase family protein [Armatimonadota bacterium]|nr:SGNH/GDSL hydrolase family protein [Thermoguttaceae bacterium]HUV04850.1 SGNH/GDSL hydrolase family protein [Armatimonadota bacterium]
MNALTGHAESASSPTTASFAEFDRKAKAGEPLTVVFFGGSLTWGANASDPQLTSYRALMGRYLQERYPKCPFTLRDAAIGGTGSDLGMFRLERDVLAAKPDLVFLDFTANDGIDEKDPKNLVSYETILRTLIGRGIPVEQVFFGFKWHFAKDAKPGLAVLRTAHIELANAYHTGQGDLHPVMKKAIAGGTDIDALWPFDQAHPDDAGYAVFYDAVRQGFQQAVAEGRVCTVPKTPLYGEYRNRSRIRLVKTPLPQGWSRAMTYRTSLWFDGLSSRWMDDVALCDAKHAGAIEPLRIKFEGTFVGLFGEANQDGLAARIRIDGKPHPYVRYQGDKAIEEEVWPLHMPHGNGNLFLWRPISRELAPGKHVLEIVPLLPKGAKKGQLRLESICVAGL